MYYPSSEINMELDILWRLMASKIYKAFFLIWKDGLVIFEQMCFSIISRYPLILSHKILFILTYRDKQQQKIHRIGIIQN